MPEREDPKGEEKLIEAFTGKDILAFAHRTLSSFDPTRNMWAQLRRMASNEEEFEHLTRLYAATKHLSGLGLTVNDISSVQIWSPIDSPDTLHVKPILKRKPSTQPRPKRRRR